MTALAKPRVEITSESPKDRLRAFGALVCKNRAIQMTGDTWAEKGRLASEAGLFYLTDMAPLRNIWAEVPLGELLRGDDGAIKAADFVDPGGGLGTLSGTLVLMQSLELFAYEYPILSAIFQDFSDQPGQLNQTEMTRIVVKSQVQTYDTSLDAAGRPKGWSTVSPGRTIDVPVTLDEYVGIPLVFGAQTLASTGRQLFEEQGEAMVTTLAGYMVDKIMALLTPANFNAYKINTIGGGATTNGSNQITVASTANMYPGQVVTGAGIPDQTIIIQIVDGVTAAISNNATATAAALNFGLNAVKLPQTYATVVQQLADFDLAALDNVAGALDLMEVPLRNRLALLSSKYYRKLRQDPSLNMFFAAQQMPSIITEGRLPQLTGFAPYNAPYFPTDNNRVGFLGHKASVIVKTRLANDFSRALQGVPIPGSITTVKLPGVGFTVGLVQYVNLQQGYAECRVEVMLGAAPGDKRGGLVMTSA